MMPVPEGSRVSATSAATWRRWLAFNLVGGLGVALQLSLLTALTALGGVHYLLATALAVEAAVLHNFIWHERFTWRDRARLDPPGRWRRLVRFQCANGALSVGGNMILMPLLVAVGEMNYLPANLVAIAVCSILNFFAGDRWVFAPARRA